MDGSLNPTREIAWSPDGEWLAFDGYLAAGDNSRGALQIVHPDGTGLRTIDAGSSTAYGDGDIGGFSPDGSRVLVTFQDRTPTQIIAVALSGAVTHLPHRARARRDTAAPLLDTDTSWLPSGTRSSSASSPTTVRSDMHRRESFRYRRCRFGTAARHDVRPRL